MTWNFTKSETGADVTDGKGSVLVRDLSAAAAEILVSRHNADLAAAVADLVPMSDDGEFVFIDGPGDVELDHQMIMRKTLEAIAQGTGVHAVIADRALQKIYDRNARKAPAAAAPDSAEASAAVDARRDRSPLAQPQKSQDPHKSLQAYALGGLTVYAVVAILSGVAMYRAMPALNALGGIYVGITWPGAMACAATQIPDCTVLPPPGSKMANAFFNFQEE